jgi:hypothetical protein
MKKSSKVTIYIQMNCDNQFIFQGLNTKKPMLETLQATLKAKQKIKTFNANIADNRKIISKEGIKGHTEGNELI